jgi:hypothetical protein
MKSAMANAMKPGFQGVVTPSIPEIATIVPSGIALELLVQIGRAGQGSASAGSRPGPAAGPGRDPVFDAGTIYHIEAP